MQEDFHYYATYCAACIAGYSHEDCLAIAYSANYVDLCTKSALSRIGAPQEAATTQSMMELADSRTDILGLQDITRIWASFHFLPKDLYADVNKGYRRYKEKYRMICGPDSVLLEETVRLAKGKSLQAAGVAMHVLADTWAHMNFAGTPSLVINNINDQVFELLAEGDSFKEVKIAFKHSPGAADDPEKGLYNSSIFQIGETSIMNLGHGRIGHLPDYSYIRYKYMPAWGDYRMIEKDNPSDYYKAFCQMIFALKYLKGDNPSFEKGKYDFDAAQPYKERIDRILRKRQVIACEDWKAFGRELSGREIPAFDDNSFDEEYKNAPEDSKDDTFLGKFILAALAQKSMVTNKIYSSGSRLAGVSIRFNENGLKGIKAYHKLAMARKEGRKK